MILRLYYEHWYRLGRELKSVPYLEKTLQETTDVEQQIKIRKLLEERKDPLRQDLFLCEASKMITPYYDALAEYKKQMRLLSERKVSATPEQQTRIDTELLRCKRQLCQFDNIISHQFIQQYCPSQKIKAIQSSVTGAGATADDRICPFCNVLMTLQQDHTFSCSCGYSVSAILNNPEQTCSYERLMHMTAHRKFTYRRINHFRETLRHAQGKSNTQIKEKCRQEIEKELQRRPHLKQCLTPKLMGRILKKIRYPEYYEEKVTLTCEFNPAFKPIEITPQQETMLCRMFAQIEKAYDQIKHMVDPGRKNFMSYPGIARRLCHLCGWDHLMKAFPLLKDAKLRVKQDEYFKFVCRVLGWEFNPTVGDVSRGGLEKQMEIVEPPAKKARVEPVDGTFENDEFVLEPEEHHHEEVEEEG